MYVPTVLVIEDDEEIREGIRIILEAEGHTVLEAPSGEAALQQLNDSVDVVILDNMLPGMSGVKTCEEIRRTSNVPIIFLSAKVLESDKIIGLMAGGDDYMEKPFSFAELLERVNAQLRRYVVYSGKQQESKMNEDAMLCFGRLKVAVDSNAAWKDGEALNLTDTEYKILSLLMKHPDKVFSTDMIYEHIWEEEYSFQSNNTVMVHVRKLRMKIEDDPKNPEYIINVWGKGYRFGGRA